MSGNGRTEEDVNGPSEQPIFSAQPLKGINSYELAEWDDDDDDDDDDEPDDEEESQLECDECGGTGEVVVGEDEDGDDVIDECDGCQGAGWI